MRKKIAVAVGLVLLAVLVIVLVVLWMQPAGPPLQIGMSEEEVDRAMGNPGVNLAYSGYPVLMYFQGPDLVGNEQRVIVQFDREGRVANWSVTSSRTGPPWLDWALKWLGGEGNRVSKAAGLQTVSISATVLPLPRRSNKQTSEGGRAKGKT